MKRTLSTLALWCSAIFASGQTATTVFTDDFNRASLSPGGTPTETYNTNVSTGGASIATALVSGSNYQVNITSGTGAAAQTKNLLVAPLDVFGAPFNTTLNANTGIVTWTFNMRTNTAVVGLPAQGSMGGGVDLCGDAGANILSGAPTGYGVVFNSGTTGGVSLLRFSGGLTTGTAIITQTTTMSKTNFYSVRVTYDPTTNGWSLFVRDDGAAAFADPSTGVTAQQGSTVVDATYTGQVMTNWGAVYTNTASTAGKVMSIDNFKVTVTVPACSGTPVPGNTLASLSSVCSGNSTVLTLQNFSPGTVTYDWKSAPDVGGLPGTFTPTGVTTASYTPTITGSKWYKCDVTCSGSTGTSNPVLVSVANCLQMIKNTTLSSTICGPTNLYDAGGASGNYTNNETNIYTIYPGAGSSGSKVTCTSISFDTEANYDSVSIFDGNSTSAPRLVKYTNTGSATPGITSTAADGSLTFLFKSDISNVGNGFAAILNVTNPNPIVTHPVASTTVCSGISVSLFVTSTGTNTYQWYNNGATNSNTGGTLIAGATNATFAPSTSSGGTTYYYCVVKNECNVSFSSSTSAVIVNARPVITSVTAGPTPMCLGAELTLSAVASSTSGSITYSWTGPNWYSNTTADASHTFTVFDLEAAGSYSLSVTDAVSGCAGMAASSNAIEVRELPGVVLNLSPSTLCVGDVMTLTATDMTGLGTPLAFDWTGPSGYRTTTTSATQTYSVPSMAATGPYYLMVTYPGEGCVSYLGTSFATVNNRPNGSDVNLSAASACAGSGSVVTINSTSLGSGTFSFKYDLSGVNASTNNMVSVTITGNTGNFTIPSSLLTAAGATTITVTSIVNTSGCDATLSSGNSASFNINPSPAAVTVINNGLNCGTATVFASNGGSGTIYYQGTTSGGTDISTPSSSQIVTVSSTYYFRAQSSAGCWGSEGSVAVTVNSQPASVNVSGGGTHCTSATIIAENGGDGTIYFQGTTSGGVSTTTAASSQLITTTGTYYFRAQSAAGCWGTEGSVSVTINTTPTAAVASGAGVFCESATITATNGDDGTMYFQGTTSGGTSTATPSASETITSSGTYYFRARSADGCWGSEGGVSVTVNPRPADVLVNGAGTFCGSTAITADNGGDGIIYFQNTSSGATSIATVSSSELISTSGTYYFRAQSAQGCWSNEGSASVTINHVPAVTIVSGGGVFCDVATITATNGNDGTMYYQGTTPGGASTVTPSSSEVITSSGTYYFRAQSADGCWGAEGSVSVTVNPRPADVVVSGAGTFCGSSSITADNGSDGILYFQGTTTNGTSITAVSASEIIITSGTYYFRARSADGCWSNEGSATLTINQVPAATTVSGAGSFCDASAIMATNGNDGTMYFQGTTSGGTSTATPSSSETITLSGTYYFRAQSNDGCWGAEESAAVTINTHPQDVTVSGAGVFCGSGMITADNNGDGTLYFQGTSSGGTSVAVPSSSEIITASGTYYFRAQSAEGCWSNEGSAMVTVNQIPGATIVSGGGVFCDVATITATNGGDGTIYFQGTIAGGTDIAIPSVSEVVNNTGIYFFRTLSAEGCWGAEGSATVTVNPLPAIHTLSGGGGYCPGDSGIPVRISGSDIGINYQLYCGSVAIDAPVGGTNSTITFGTYTTAGTYTVLATDATSGCTQNMSGSPIITVNPLPPVHTVTGTGSYCAGGAGVVVGLDGSDNDVDYSLYDGSTIIGTAHGNTLAVSFGAQTTAATYTVVATDAVTGCSSNMAGSATVVINPLLTPAINIVTAAPATICAGASMTFTTTDMNAGTAPSYQWYIGTVPVPGATTAAFSSSSLADNDIVSVRLNSNAVCATPGFATDDVTMTVIAGQMPVVSIASTPGSPVCENTVVNFTTTTTFGGSAPGYIWYRNGVNVGAGSTYSYIPANGDVVYCKLLSDLACRLQDTVSSSSINMRVNPTNIPLISLSVSPGMYIMAGQTDTIMATVVNGGVSPSYQWYVNSKMIAGANTSVYVSDSLANKDSVTCVVVSDGPCGIGSFNSMIILVKQTEVVTPFEGISDLRITPNPGNGNFILTGIASTDVDQNGVIEVVDMLGQLVYQKSMAIQHGGFNEPIQLDPSLANGTYIVNVKCGEDRKVLRVMVVR